MKKVDTLPGKWYAVTSTSGCTVSFETNGGTVTLDMQAPQDVFCAVSGKATVSDDFAVVTQTFNLAPSFFKAARGWGQDPIWFKSLHAVLTRLLDGTQFEMVLTEQGSKLIVHTDRVADDLLEQVRTTAEAYLPAGVELVQYNHNMEISWRDINKYEECTNIEDMLSVNPDYKNDLTSDGEWIYPLPKMVYAGGVYPHYQGIFKGAQKLKKIKIVLPKAHNIGYSFNTSSLEELDIEVPIIKSDAYTNVGHLVDGFCVPKKLRFVAPLHLNFRNFLWNGTRQKHLELYAPNMREGTFVAQLDKESALGILTRLGVFANETNTLLIGIHIDYQHDEEVLAAIAEAEAKGWTLTVQWNGTQTTATTSTFGMGSLIYAKVGEHELPDGTTERVLDWGHYVTDETGYETFRSLGSAYEYYGLPMPAEESQPTE